KSREEVERLFKRFHELVTAPPDRAAANAAPELGKLAVFSGVCEFPVRVKCASLPWHTLKAALQGEVAPVSTELSESSSGDGAGGGREQERGRYRVGPAPDLLRPRDPGQHRRARARALRGGAGPARRRQEGRGAVHSDRARLRDGGRAAGGHRAEGARHPR